MKYQFNKWQLCTDTKTLTNDDKKQIDLHQNIYCLLKYFVEHSNQVVTKAELLDLIWKDTTVTENSLNQLIAELRKLLGDDAKHPVYVKTLPKKGFSFLAKVKTVNDSSDDSEMKGLYKSISLSLLFVALFIVAFIFYNPHQQSRYGQIVSPDGKAVAYFTDDTNGVFLTIEFNDKFKAPVVTKIEQPSSHVFAWSSDSQRLVYNATQSEQPYYAFNVLSLANGQTEYFKTSKLPQISLKDSLPESFKKAVEATNHDVKKLGKASISSINYSETEVINVLIEDNKVISFSWQQK